MNFAGHLIEMMVSYYTGIACVLFLFIGHQLGHEILHLLLGGGTALVTFILSDGDPTWMFVCMLFLGFFFLLPPMAIFIPKTGNSRKKTDPSKEDTEAFRDQFQQYQKERGFQNGHKGWSKSRREPNSQRENAPANLYAKLGLQQGKRYSKAQLKRAFYKRAKKAHPDKGGSAAQFNELKAAYDTLMAAR